MYKIFNIIIMRLFGIMFFFFLFLEFGYTQSNLNTEYRALQHKDTKTYFSLDSALKYKYEVLKLEVLILSQDDITKINELPNLMWLDLKNKNIAEVVSLEQLNWNNIRGVQHLSLKGFNFNMDSICHLNFLRYLALPRNNIKKIPDNINKLKYLNFLDISNNDIRKLPLSVCNLKYLKELYLQSNKLQVLPTQFGLLKGLRRLKVQENILEDLPNTFCDLRNLFYLDISSNKLEKLPNNLYKIKLLSDLNASNNNIIEIPESLYNLDFLLKLDLSRNQISKLNPSIINIGIFEIDLSGNQLTELPKNFWQRFGSANKINISYNLLTQLPEYYNLPSVSYELVSDLPTYNPKVIKSLNISGNDFKTFPSVCFKFPIGIFNADNLDIDSIPNITREDSLNQAVFVWYDIYSKKLILDELNDSIQLMEIKLIRKRNSSFILSSKLEKIKEEHYSLRGTIKKDRQTIKLQNKEINKQKGEKKNIEAKNLNNISKIKKTEFFLITTAMFLIVAVVALTLMILSKRKLKIERNKLKKTRESIIEYEKKEYITNLVVGLAHDLKTPLGNAILSSSTLLDESKEVEKVLEHQQLTAKQSMRYTNKTRESSFIILQEMNKIKDWVQDFQVITNDQVKNEVRTINLKDYIQLSMQTLSFKLHKSNIRYSVSCEQNIEIETLPGFISQITQNIVNNAMEHGFEDYEMPNKKIEISIYEKNNLITMIFSNNGRQISKENHKKIFDRGFTGKTDEIRGKGLAHVKKLVTESLKGQIGCSFDDNSKTKFIINFPK